MDLITVLSGIGIVVTVLGLLGGALALLRGSYNKARIEALQGDNNDLRLRLGDHEAAIKLHEAKEEAQEVRIKHLEDENEMLMGAVTQKADVESVKELLTSHHEQMQVINKKNHEETMKKMDAMITAFRGGGGRA